MGGHNSKAQIDQTALNKAIQTTIVKNTAKNTATANAVQTVDIKNTKFLHCNFEVSQQATVNLDVLQQFTAETTSELKAKIKQELESQLENKMKPEAELLGPPMVTNTDSSLRTTVENIIETEISVENLNEQIAKVDAFQTQNFEGVTVDKCPGYDEVLKILAERAAPASTVTAFVQTCDQNSKCGIDQNLKVDLVAQQITQNLVKAIQDNEVVQKETAKVVNDVAPKSKGISPMFGGLSSGGSCCLCCFIIIAFFLMGAAKKKIQ